MGSYVVHNAPQGGPAPACNFPGGNFADGNAICDWDYRKKVTIDNTKVSADLTDYLLMVDLADMGSNFHSNAKSDGSDIRVTKSDGTTELAYYISQIDTTAETGIMWVRYNGTLSSTVDTDIYIYYANASANAYAVGATYGRNNTFQDYEAFWDFEQDPSGSAPQLTDLTGNGNDGTTAGGMTSGDEVAGKVGNAWDFDGINDQAQYDRFIVGTNNITIGGWAKWSGTGPQRIFGAYRGALNYQYSITQTGLTGFPIRYNFMTDAAYFVQGSAGNDNTWHHLVMTAQRGVSNGIKGYFDGSIDAQGQTINNTSIDYSNNPIYRIAAGNGIDGTTVENFSYLNGDVSVNYLRFDVLSADHISTEYANQNSPSTFYTVGSQETS